MQHGMITSTKLLLLTAATAQISNNVFRRVRAYSCEAEVQAVTGKAGQSWFSQLDVQIFISHLQTAYWLEGCMSSQLQGLHHTAYHRLGATCNSVNRMQIFKSKYHSSLAFHGKYEMAEGSKTPFVLHVKHFFGLEHMSASSANC